jgi:hypothetical protein
MTPLIISSIIVSLIYLADSWLIKSKRTYADYFALFLLLAGVQYAFRSYKVEASVFDKYITQKPGIVLTVEDKTQKTSRDVKKEFMNKCKDKMNYHHEEAEKCFKCAEEACLLLPGDEKERAEWCFASAIATLYPGSPAQRVVAGIITLCAQYGNAVRNEWMRIDSLLRESKHHYEMESHYIMMYNYHVSLLNAEKREEKGK